MKKMFTEPEIEILTFLCNESGYNSVTTGGNQGEGGDLGLDDDETLITN